MNLYFSDDGVYIIAKDKEDAQEIYDDMIGSFHKKFLKWDVLSSDKEFTMADDDGGNRETKTVGEWVKSEGRGILTWKD